MRNVVTLFDVGIVGGGTAGISAAIEAARLGKSVCLVEKFAVGGGDLWSGTLPSKILWDAARQHRTLTRCKSLSLSHAPSLIETSTFVRRHYEDVAVRRYRKKIRALRAHRVHVVKGTAALRAPREIEVSGRDGISMIQTRFSVVATGSSPQVGIWKDLVDGKTIVTSESLMARSVPRSLIIVGGGSVGCEMASTYADLGCDVTLLERKARLLHHLDSDVSIFIQGQLTERGVRICLNSSAVEISKNSDEVNVKSETGIIHRGECSLLAIGRKSDTTSVLKYTHTPCLQDDLISHDRAHNVCLCGDAATANMTSASAQLSGRVAMRVMVSQIESTLRPPLPAVYYAGEEIAGVGHPSPSLLVGRCRMDDTPRGVARGAAVGSPRSEGFVKVFVADTPMLEICAVLAAGTGAGEVVSLASSLVARKTPLSTLAKLSPAYGSIGQGLDECARRLLRQVGDGVR